MGARIDTRMIVALLWFKWRAIMSAQFLSRPYACACWMGINGLRWMASRQDVRVCNHAATTG